MKPLPLHGGTIAAAAARQIGNVSAEVQWVEIYNLEPWPLTIVRGEVLGHVVPLLDRTRLNAKGRTATSFLADPSDTGDRAEFEEALKELDINPELTQSQRTALLDVLRVNRLAFAYGSRPLGHTNLGTARIDTGDTAPISVPPFRVSPAGRKFMEDEVARLLANNVIEESDSPWATNVVLIKQHGK
ncbi:hypothetical protein EXIGLDRAFT_625747, partial [Exidia glandulosa HHB12029]